MKFATWFFILGIGATLLTFVYSPNQTNTSTPTPVAAVAISQEEAKVPELPKEASFLFVGDVMLDRGIKQVVTKKFDGDYGSMFEFVRGDISSADFSMFNLEGPVSDKGANVGSIYSFRMATATILALKDAGFDIASFANNHVGDWGRLAFNDTLDRLDSAGVSFIGAGRNIDEATNFKIYEKNGVRVAMLAFSDVTAKSMQASVTTSGTNLLSDPHLVDYVRLARANADHVIVSVHWGEEYSTTTVARQVLFGHKLIDWGADVVIGHHPHVIEPIEEYKGGIIAYSLGNFIFDQAFSKETMEGGVLNLVFTKDSIKSSLFRRVKLDSDFRSAFIADDIVE